MSLRGWVYVMTNESMPGLVKVGYSTKDPSLRASELDGTGLPTPYCVAYDALVLEPRKVEGLAHKHLSGLHHAKEFFRCSVEVAIAAIRANAEIILENSCTVSESTGLVQDGSGADRQPAVSPPNGAREPGLKKQSKAVGGYQSMLSGQQMVARFRLLGASANSAYVMPGKSGETVTKEVKSSSAQHPSAATLQQQAQEWINERKRLSAARSRLFEEEGVCLSLKPSTVNPEYLDEPLRSEVMRQLGMESIVTTNDVRRPQLSEKELVARFQRASAYAHRSDVEPTDRNGN